MYVVYGVQQVVKIMWIQTAVCM